MLRLIKNPATRTDFYLKRAAASADAANTATSVGSPEAAAAFRVLERLWLDCAAVEQRQIR